MNPAALLAIIRQLSRHEFCGHLAIIRQLSRHESCGPAGDYQADEQGILKEISPGISLVGMMLKLKLQYFGHVMRSVDSLEKTLMLGGIGGRRRRG